MTCFSHRFNSDAHAHKDYVMMYVHHLATIALVAMSYWSGLTRIGLIILFIHDCSDIGIDLLKLSNYLSIDGPRNFFLVEVSYACAIVMWIYFRLWYFPVYIIYYGVVGALGYIGPSVHGHVPAIETISGPYRDQIMIVVACGVFLLTLLFCMHVFWFFLLIRILVRMICESDRKKIGNDEYEGDHGDVAHGDTTDKHIEQSSPKPRSKGGKKSD
jgi:ceramide synthetase